MDHCWKLVLVLFDIDHLWWNPTRGFFVHSFLHQYIWNFLSYEGLKGYELYRIVQNGDGTGVFSFGIFKNFYDEKRCGH